MKSKITTLGVVSTFLISNAFFVTPLSPAYGATTPDSAKLAAVVQPLGVSYAKPGSEHIHTDPSKWQRLTTPKITLNANTTFSLPAAEAVKILPSLDELTTANTYELSDDEYFKVVAANRSYDVLKSIEIAYADVGNVYPTGWSQRGECIMSVSHWLKSAGVTWGEGGTPTKNYSTAKRVPLENLQAGDVIQYINLEQPEEWISGVHTVLITGNNWDGTYKIVEANNPGGSGLVSKNDSWVPRPPAGFEAAAFRF